MENVSNSNAVKCKNRYIPEYAIITPPLRALTKKETPWQWSDEKQHAFEKLKESLTESHVILQSCTSDRSDSRRKPCRSWRITSAGRHGYQLRESSTQRRVNQILTNREGNAGEHVGFGTLSSYGSEFTIVTDHKPLLSIFNSEKPTSAGMDRWKLRLMPYNCHLVYRPEKDAENPADFMSRHPNLQANA
ncbi:hypothetical protein ACROYT_G040144 [Oculina patagonica]